MAVNTYGLKMTGLKAVVSETNRSTDKNGRGDSVQITYDRKAKKLSAKTNSGRGYTMFDDDADTITVHANRPMTQQQVADVVREKIFQRARVDDNTGVKNGWGDWLRKQGGSVARDFSNFGSIVPGSAKMPIRLKQPELPKSIKKQLGMK